MKKKLSLAELQGIILDIYGIPDDQLYTVEDLIYFSQKFALIGIKRYETKDKKAMVENFIISLAWFLALSNRYHFDLEELVWKRYSFKCPFCLEIPCICEDKEEAKAMKTGRPSSRRPERITAWQEMVKKIYPKENINELIMFFLRKTDDLSYSFRLFIKERQMKHFREIEIKSADYFILFLRIFNAMDTNLEKKFYSMFKRGCHVCSKTPCVCNYY